MPPNEYSFKLQKGITGGFAPPTPDAIHVVSTNPQSSNLVVSSAIRPTGTPSLQDALSKSLSTDDEAHALVDELHGILREIPTEDPPGSQDIYELNTSIAWGSEDFVWQNGGPSGCGSGQSMVQPTIEQKRKFKRAVDIVLALVNKAD